jgi:uncharacterized protein YggE
VTISCCSKLACIVLALLLGLSLAHAHEEVREPIVRVVGDALVMAEPDQAELDIGVVTEAKTAASAADQNAQRAQRVISELKKALGADAVIKTLAYSVNPNYRYPREGGRPEITGYTAANVVRVTLQKLDQVGRTIDAATQASANTIQNLRYSLKDENPARAQALREAAENAKEKADALAAALALKLVRIISISENRSPVIPLAKDVALAEARSSATPIEAGTIEVRAEVTLEATVAPK